MQQAVELHETAAAPLGSFPAIFSQAMSLGLLSKRRVYQEAMQVLRNEQGSLRSLIGECYVFVPMCKLQCVPQEKSRLVYMQSCSLAEPV